MQPYCIIRAVCLTLSDTLALSEIQVRHCYICPPWRVEGAMPYVNKISINCPPTYTRDREKRKDCVRVWSLQNC